MCNPCCPAIVVHGLALQLLPLSPPAVRLVSCRLRLSSCITRRVTAASVSRWLICVQEPQQRLLTLTDLIKAARQLKINDVLAQQRDQKAFDDSAHQMRGFGASLSWHWIDGPGGRKIIRRHLYLSGMQREIWCLIAEFYGMSHTYLTFDCVVLQRVSDLVFVLLCTCEDQRGGGGSKRQHNQASLDNLDYAVAH